MAEPDIQRYLDGIESQHKLRPRYMAHVTALLEKIDGATAAASDMLTAFFLDTAVGDQLDKLGLLIGFGRTINIEGSPYYGTVLTDDQYRTMLYAKIFANHWDGSIEHFKTIWDQTLANVLEAHYVDNMDMTVTIVVDGIVSDLLLHLIPGGHLVPKPMGVRYKVLNREPVSGGTIQMYAGAAIFSEESGEMETDNPDIDAMDFLGDGAGNYLADGRDIVFFE